MKEGDGTNSFSARRPAAWCELMRLCGCEKDAVVVMSMLLSNAGVVNGATGENRYMARELE